MAFAKGSVPEFGDFGENSAGFTGMFEVKRAKRKEGDNDLDFPEPAEQGGYDKEPKKGKKGDKGGKKEEEAAQGGCCTLM